MKNAVLVILLLSMFLVPATSFAATDGFYNLTASTVSWDGTNANRLIAPTADYVSTYGDESSVTYALPWSFNFYGQTYSQITADTNGNIWFTSSTPAHNINLANSGLGPVISAWNNDLSSYYYGGTFIQHKTNPERVVIEWQTETYAKEGFNHPNDFEVVLFPNGSIRFDYKSFSSLNSTDTGSGVSNSNSINFISISSLFGNVFNLAGQSFLVSPSSQPVAVVNPYLAISTQTTRTICGTVRGTGVSVTINNGATVDQVTNPTSTTWCATVSNLPSGTSNISVMATDASGNQVTSLIPITVGSLPSGTTTSLPTVVLSYPANGAVVNNTPLLNYSVSNGSVVVTLDGNTVSQSSGSYYGPMPAGSNSATIPAGQHIVSVAATDNNGNVATAEASFTVKTTAPILAASTVNTSINSHVMAILTNGTLWGWGDDGYGELGDGANLSQNGSTLTVLSPEQVGVDNSWLQVATGESHTVALKMDGSLWAWGNNSSGEIGTGASGVSVNSTVRIGTDSDWAAVSAGSNFSVALKKGGTLWSWGNNQNYQLGDGTTNNNATPTEIGTDNNWTEIACGFMYTLALKSDGTLWGWGNLVQTASGNSITSPALYAYAQESMEIYSDAQPIIIAASFPPPPSNSSFTTPQSIGTDSDWQSIAAGSAFSLALKKNGTLWAWGSNQNGQMGNGSTIDIANPTAVNNDTNWSSIAAGDGHVLAVKTDGTLWAWGSNSNGQLGDGTEIDKHSPVQIGIGTTWKTVKAGGDSSLAIKADGSLWAWGSNENGELGIGFTADQNMPTLVLLENSSGLMINQGEQITTSAAVVLSYNAADTFGVSTMQFSNDSNQWSDPEPYTNNKNWTLSAGDGTKTVYAHFSDVAGNWSKIYSSSIVLSTQPNNGVPATVPNAPSNVTAIAGNSQATVSFTAPVSNGGSVITSYTVTSSPGNISSTSPASPIIINGLANGTAYTFSVVATNVVGNSTASAPSNSVIPATVPGAPTGVTAVAGNSQATISFLSPVFNGGSAITSYLVSSNPGNITISGPTSPLTVSGLTNGVTYTFTVSASNASWSGPASSPSNVVTPAIPNAGPNTTASPPSGLYDSALNVVLSCNDGIGGSGCAATYYCLGQGCIPTIPFSGAISISSSQILRYYSIDNAGNTEAVKETNYWENTITATSQKIITTVAGGGVGDGGVATLASIKNSTGVIIDKAGNLIIADSGNNLIRKIDAVTGIITTVAGNGTVGYSGDGGQAVSASLNNPLGVALDSAGNIYIADYHNNVVRKVNTSTGLISTVAGNGTSGYSGDGSPAGAANLNYPAGIAFDAAGNLFIDDSWNHVIRRVDAITGIISTVAGNGNAGYSGDGMPAVAANLNYPESIAFDGAGNLFIADSGNNCIRKVDANSGIITTVAGNGTAGYSGDGMPAVAANLNYPTGVTFDAAGNLYIADNGNFVVRKVNISTGNISTIAGNGNWGFSGDGGLATGASIETPSAVAVDNIGNVYIADSGAIRKVYISTGIITTVAGTGIPGFSGDGGLATAASLNYPNVVIVDSTGNFYLIDNGNNVIRKVNVSTGIITTVAGNGSSGYTADGVAATAASFNSPDGIAVDESGNFYIADSFNNYIRKINPTTGLIITVAGNGIGGYSGDGGIATAASLNYPTNLTVDGSGNLFIVDSGNNCIRRVDAVSGNISTVAGNGTAGYSGDGGAATAASLQYPTSVIVDVFGNLFIADTSNNSIRRVDALSGNISTVAGNGTAGYSGDGGPATAASIDLPQGVSLDSAGNLYIADTYNNCIRRVDALSGNISTVAGNGIAGYSGDGGLANAANVSNPTSIAIDSANNLYIADTSNNRIRKVFNGTLNVSTASPSGGTYASPQLVTLSANVPSTIYYTIDSSIPITSLSVYSGPITISSSTTIRFFSVDNSGNTESVKSATYTIASLAGAPVGVTAVAGNGQAVVSFTPPNSNGGSPIISYTVTASPGNITATGTTSPVTVTGLNNGIVYTFTVTAINAAGIGPVSSPSTGITPMVPDIIPPVTTVSPAGGLYSAAQNVTLSCSDGAGGSGCASIFYCLGSGCTPSTLYTGAIPITTSAVLSYFSKDNAGNSETIKLATFTINPSPPSVTIISPISGFTNNKTPLLSYTVSDGVVVVKLDGSVINKVSGQTLDSLADGIHTLVVQSTNAVGNVGSASSTFTILTVPPTLSVNQVTTPSNVITQILTGNVGSSATVTISSARGGSVGTISYPASSTWSCQVSLVSGTNTFIITATDQAGNVSTTSVPIIYTPPLSVSLSPATIADSYQGNVVLSVNNIPTPGNSVLVEQLVDANQNGVIDAGDYIVRSFTVTDGIASVNPNVQGDEDGTANAAITTTFNYYLLNDLYHAPGHYIFRVTSGSNVATSAPFIVTNVSQPQSISGSVTVNSAPIPGAIVQLTDKWSRPVSFTLADANGSYTIPVPSAGSYFVNPIAYGYVAGVSQTPISVATGQTVTGYDLTMTLGVFQVTGQLTDSVSGLGIDGVWINAANLTTNSVAMTGSDGSYELLLPANIYSIAPTAEPTRPNLSSKGYIGYSNLTNNVNVTTNITGMNLTLPQGNSLISGTVSNSQGSQIQGIPVQGMIPTSSNLNVPVVYGVTNGNGIYTLAIPSDNTLNIGLQDFSAQVLGYVGTNIGNYSTTNSPPTGNNLTAYPISAWVKGTVKDSNNYLLGGIGIQLRNADSTIVTTTTTASDGTYLIGAFAGTWYVDALTANSGLLSVPEQSTQLTNAQTSEVDFIVDAAPPTVTTTSLAGGYVNVAYNQTLAASGGVAPYTWSITSGSLPAGLTLNASTGSITGTPTTTGADTFTVQAKDSNGITATMNQSIVISFINVSSQISVTTYNVVYSRATKLYSATITITNNGPSLTGKIDIALTNPTPGLILTNATGTYLGAQYLTVSTTDLASGASVSTQVFFSDPSGGSITFTPVTYQE